VTTFRLATADDDEMVRSILRDNGMPTWVDMAVTREPSFLASADLFGRDWAVIAEEAGEVIGMYTAAVLPVHVDGHPEQLGYLGGLRVRPVHRRRVRHLREGYASIGRLAPVTGTIPGWFTVIASENRAARRLLESGLRGLPPYRFEGEYVTLGLPTARGKCRGLWRRAGESDVAPLIEFHNAQAARFQFSPVLREEVVRRIGVGHFVVHERDGALRGVAALWDQRGFKQIVARRYRPPVGALLPVYNAYARVCRRIPLPREGRALEQTCLAFLELSDEAVPESGALLSDLLSRCATPVASIGLHARHPLSAVLDELKPMRYPARVYSVSFERRSLVSQRPVQPEVALL
jgi:hypothetical protein